jgi:DNA polymerase III psi subunit
MINQSLVYKELNLLPVWKLKKDEASKNENIFNFCRISFNNKPIFFISMVRRVNIDKEKKMFLNIMNYIKSITDEGDVIKLANQNIMENEIMSSKGAYIFFIGKDRFQLSEAFNLDEYQVSFSSVSSLADLTANINNKKRLWQDIQHLIKSIK